MVNFTVVYDACLFYPAPLRDLMIRLAQTRRFRARWTEAIQREWLTALLRNRPELDELRQQGLPGVAAFLQNEIALI